MSDNQKYYYLKLKEDFFESDEVLFLESMPEGYKYSNILLKLYLRSLKNNGKLMMNNLIPYNAEMLATITRHSVGDIKQAIQIFSQLGLVEQLDNGAIYMLQIQNFIGKSSTEGDRKRAYRRQIEQEKEQMMKIEGQMSGQMSGLMSDKQAPELELDIELDIELELDNKDIHNYLKKLNLSTDQIKDTIKVLRDMGKDKEYLQEKVKLMDSRGKEVKSNFGYLLKAIKEDWKIQPTTTTTYKTKFHNFQQVKTDKYSTENLQKLVNNSPNIRGK